MKLKLFSIIRHPALCALLVLVALMACKDEKKTTEPEPETETEMTEPSDKDIHVAFAGGGWRAHTGHSGWILALLQNGSLNLGEAFKNVGTIGSNSGGTWFSTMLTLSDTFVSDIQKAGAITTWGQTGWLGMQHELFKNTKACDHFYDDWYGYTLCVLDANDNESRDWVSIVEDIVYKGYSLNGATLSGPRAGWAKDKTLLAAGSMLTSNVLLNSYGENFRYERDKYQYYQACLNPGSPDMGGLRLAATCDNNPVRYSEVMPVIFSGLPSGSTDTAPAFLPVLESGGYFNIGYSEVIAAFPTEKDTTITNPSDNDQVLAVHASAASSAALGFMAYVRQYDLKWWWDDAHWLRKLAPSFSLNGSVKFEPADSLTVDQLASKKMVRIADGGPVDNSGVAQIVKYLQLNGNGPGNGFDIVAFDNVTSAYDPGSGAKVGVDIANLFGQGLCNEGTEFCVEGCSILEQVLGCVYVPEIQIFDEGALSSTPHTWHVSDGNMEIIYTQYKVTTVANSNFGIAPNTTGTLHSFTCVAPDAGTVPTDSEFTGYYDMLNFIYTQASTGEGLTHLKNAFGLK